MHCSIFLDISNMCNCSSLNFTSFPEYLRSNITYALFHVSKISQKHETFIIEVPAQMLHEMGAQR